MFDPEIATVDGSFDGETLLFCMGNLAHRTYETFFAEHTCNELCKLIGLQYFETCQSFVIVVGVSLHVSQFLLIFLC